MEQIPDTLQQVIADFLLFLPKLLSALVIFALSLYLANLISILVRRFLERRRTEPGTVLLLFLLTRWGITILGVIYALQQVEFQLTAFLAGLGIIGFTIGFALQDISQNIVAGLLLLIPGGTGFQGINLDVTGTPNGGPNVLGRSRDGNGVTLPIGTRQTLTVTFTNAANQTPNVNVYFVSLSGGAPPTAS